MFKLQNANVVRIRFYGFALVALVLFVLGTGQVFAAAKTISSVPANIRLNMPVEAAGGFAPMPVGSGRYCLNSSIRSGELSKSSDTR